MGQQPSALSPPPYDKTSGLPASPAFVNEELLDLHKLLWNRGEDGRRSVYKKIPVASLSIGRWADFRSSQDCILLDLRSASLNSGDGQKILIPDQYETMLNILTEHSSSLPTSGMVITGNPGIGKSMFLRHILTERLLRGECTVVQINDSGGFYVFHDDGVTRYIGGSTEAKHCLAMLPEGVFALVDSSHTIPQPHAILYESRRLYIVQISPPRLYRWNQWMNNRNARVVFMGPWNWLEMCIAGRITCLPPIQPDVLHRSFIKYGGIPRICFSTARSEHRATNFDAQIVEAAQKLSPEHLSQVFIGYLPVEETSRLFVLTPSADCTSCKPAIISRHAAHILYDEDKSHSYKRIFDFYCRSRGGTLDPNFACLWELHVQRVLTETKQALFCRPLRTSSSLRLSSPLGPIKKITSISQGLGCNVRDKPSGFYIPATFDSPIFNPFFVDGDMVVLFQVTTSTKHVVKPTELDNLANTLKSYGIPMPWNAGIGRWHLVFVVPSEMAWNWQKQKIPVSKSAGRAWPKHFEQYVLGFALASNI